MRVTKADTTVPIYRDPCISCPWYNKPIRGFQEFSTCSNPVIVNLLRKEMIIACNAEHKVEQPCAVSVMMTSLQPYDRVTPDMIDVLFNDIPDRILNTYLKPVLHSMYIDCKDEFGTEEMYLGR